MLLTGFTKLLDYIQYSNDEHIYSGGTLNIFYENHHITKQLDLTDLKIIDFIQWSSKTFLSLSYNSQAACLECSCTHKK